MLLKLTTERMGSHMLSIAFIVGAQIIQTLSALYLPSLNANIIDYGVTKGDLPYIWKTGFLMLSVALIQALSSAMATYFSAKVAMEVGSQLRSAVFQKVQKLSQGDIRFFGAPTLITRATNDVNQVQSVIFFTFIVMIASPIMGIGGVVMALHQDLQLSWLLVGIVPIMAVTIGLLMWRLIPMFRVQQTRLDRVNNDMREQLSGVRVIRAFVREEQMAKRFDHSNRALQRVALSIGRVFSLMFPLLQLIFSASTVAVIWFGAWRIDSGSMQVGALFAFINYLSQILMSVMMSAMVFTMVPRAQICADRIGSVLNHQPSVQNAPNDQIQPVPDLPLSFSLKGVTVRFDQAVNAALSNVNFTIEPGSTWGIVGATGCGKTTLTRLFTRQIDPCEGKVSALGIDLRNFCIDQLRRRIAVVPQQVYLFAGTIATTVSALKEDQLTDSERARVYAALELAQALEFVQDLPKGIDAPVQAGGLNFSGGQRQRLSIARALYRQADLLILDDATSGLDYLTESKLLSALKDMRSKKNEHKSSLLIVSQRVSSLMYADNILVLENGMVVGMGTHEELLRTCQTYKEIVASQGDDQEEIEENTQIVPSEESSHGQQ